MTDATGNGHTLTNTGATKTTAQIDSGYSFVGTSSTYMNCTGVMGSPATLTMSCWATTSVTTQADFVSISNDAGLESNSSGNNCVFYQDNQTSNQWVSDNYSASTVLAGKGWTYVTAVINPTGSSEAYYQNGAVVAITSSANSFGTSNYPISYNISPTTTGLGYNAGSSSRYFNGSLNEVRIENTNRTPAWIALCYANEQANQTLVNIGTAPSAPSLSSPNNGTGNLATTSQTLSWGPVSGVTSYTLWVSSTGSFSSGVTSYAGLTGTSQVISSLANGTTYTWEVYSVSPNGTSAWASPYSFTTAAATGTPVLSSPSPANNAQNQALTGLTLSWSSSSGGPVTSYTVQVSTNAGFSTTLNSWTNPLLVTTTFEALPTLTNGTIYYWEVAATGPGGTSAFAGPYTFTTAAATGTPALSSPSRRTMRRTRR